MSDRINLFAPLEPDTVRALTPFASGGIAVDCPCCAMPACSYADAIRCLCCGSVYRTTGAGRVACDRASMWAGGGEA